MWKSSMPKRIALTALQSEEPVGIDLLEEMAK
jgi:hypothetical protein